MLTDDQWTDVLTSVDPIDYSTPEAYVEDLEDLAQEDYSESLSSEQVENGKWQWAEVQRLSND